MSNAAFIREAKAHMAHEIAPRLHPTARGLFRVRLRGLYRNHADISVSLVSANREVLKHFGAVAVPLGGAVIVDECASSTIQLVPGARPVAAYLQAWLIGIDADHTEAEIVLRLVDADRRSLINFGSVTRAIGGTITIEGLDVTAIITKQEV